MILLCSICNYICIYLHLHEDPEAGDVPTCCSANEQEGTGSVRFDSFRFWTFATIHRLGSVRGTNNSPQFDAVRPAFCGRIVSRSGSVLATPGLHNKISA